LVFFEYHNGVSDLDKEGIDHLKGCVLLTQSILSYDNTKNSYGSVHRAVVPLTTAGLKRLMFDDEGLRTNWQRLKPRWRRKGRRARLQKGLRRNQGKAARARLQEELRRNQRKSQQRLRISLCV